MSMPTMKCEIAASYDEALTRVREALSAEGFGVLTEIDVQKTLEQKLGVDFRRYSILGACNPKLAHRALSTDLDVGVLLPCNVAVYEGDGGRCVVSIVDPAEAIGPFGGGALADLASEVRASLSRVLQAIC